MKIVSKFYDSPGSLSPDIKTEPALPGRSVRPITGLMVHQCTIRSRV